MGLCGKIILFWIQLQTLLLTVLGTKSLPIGQVPGSGEFLWASQMSFLMLHVRVPMKQQKERTFSSVFGWSDVENWWDQASASIFLDPGL